MFNEKTWVLEAIGGHKSCCLSQQLLASVNQVLPIQKMVPYVIVSSTYLLKAIEAKPCSPMTSIMMHQFGKLVSRAFQWYVS